MNANGGAHDGGGMVIIAEQLAELGGIERIVHTLMSAYPRARLMAGRFEPKTGADGDDFANRARELGISLDRNGDGPAIRLVGPGGRRSVYLGPLYARRLAAHPLEGASTVISLGGMGWTLAANVPEGTRHLGYIGGLPRPLYSHIPLYLREHPRLKQAVLAATIPFLRAHYRLLLRRPHQLLTNSNASAHGLGALLRRPVDVIYPPARTRFFTPADEPRRHHLAVARLYLHKRLDVLLEAFRRMPGERLVVAGDGPAAAELRAAAPPNVKFVGLQQDDELRELYRSSRAVLTASVEEFGISNVEALACGVPVVAPRAGGSGEIVEDGRTGVLLDGLGADDVVTAVRRVERLDVDPAACRAASERFSEGRFLEQFARVLEPAAQLDHWVRGRSSRCPSTSMSTRSL